MRTSLRKPLDGLAQRLCQRKVRDVTYRVHQGAHETVWLDDSKLALIVNLELVATEYRLENQDRDTLYRESAALKIATGYVDVGYDYFEENRDLVDAAYALALVEVTDALSDILHAYNITTEDDESATSTIEEWNRGILTRHPAYTQLDSQTQIVGFLPEHDRGSIPDPETFRYDIDTFKRPYHTLNQRIIEPKN